MVKFFNIDVINDNDFRSSSVIKCIPDKAMIDYLQVFSNSSVYVIYLCWYLTKNSDCKIEISMYFIFLLNDFT